ncbi:MAG: hypothetical protein AAB291_01800 [Chloroflexota bacterium]
MPIYEYRCGHCQSRDMHRRISAVAVGKTARSGELTKGLDE